MLSLHTHKGCQRWLKNSIYVDQAILRPAESSTMNTGPLCFSNEFPYSLFLQRWAFIFTSDLQKTESSRVCVHCPATEPRRLHVSISSFGVSLTSWWDCHCFPGGLVPWTSPHFTFLFSTCCCIFSVPYDSGLLICIKILKSPLL